ncbi:MAG: hypothetical protein OEV01_06610 [Nitrospira sp.]|nr:hypothetical protein [Nitrospira sp.]MDH4303469.1 hypothetical protein [Nitrospira sp.]MDH5193183.1 hypothetical protein [Nitrospira sp.]
MSGRLAVPSPSKLPRVLASFLLLCTCFLLSGTSRSEDDSGPRPLWTIVLAELDQLLPSGTHILIDREAIGSFLSALEGTPPDWRTVYGRGHHGPGHDERLFNLNRERDAAREGNPTLTWRVAFVWTGELSHFDADSQSYSVAVGPEFTQTSWGVVRFKPEDLPSNLRVKPDKQLVDRIDRSLRRHEPVQVLIVMVGTLIPNESVIYDFSHEEEGVGLIMPVVKVEQVEVILVKPPQSSVQ